MIEISNLDQELFNVDYEILTEKMAEYIEKINAGNFKMSFTALKEFAKSPLAFLKYKTGEKVSTPAMKFGSLAHLVVLEPMLFNTKYIILKKAEKDKSWGTKANKLAKEEQLLKAEKEEKELVSEEDVLKALNIRKTIFSNKVSADLLTGCIEFEKKIEFEYEDLNFIGYIDGSARNYLVDLKKVVDASNPKKLKWLFRDMKWHWQAYLYNVGRGYGFQDYYNICFDDKNNVIVVKMDQFDLAIAKNEIEFYIKKFKETALMEMWEYGVEYWTETGYYKSSEL